MKQLLVLHGALGAKQQLEELKPLLGNGFNVHSLNFEGHGGRPSDTNFSIELFVENVRDYLEQNDISSCSIFGYSMGGYVALKLAAQFPGTVNEIVTLGTKFGWTPEVAVKETAMLNPEKIEEKVPKFAAALAQLHAPLDWKEVMYKTAQMMLDLGDQPALTEEELRSITIPVTLLLGSEDTMVTVEETTAVQQQLPNATFERVEGWQHPIERVNKEELAGKLMSLF
ncbi:MAG TPA: alpha/beta fold hydrolase [Fluviicola sp.]|nr:alpha/beta fold hydrolase [Fluviicola sp.]